MAVPPLPITLALVILISSGVATADALTRPSPRVAQVAAVVPVPAVASTSVADWQPMQPAGGYGPIDIAPPAGLLFRPETFGALGDGIHDDAPAVQSAIDTAAGRGTVLLSAVTYRCEVPLRLPSHTSLTGLSPRSTLSFSWTVQARTAGGGSYLVNADPSTGNRAIALTNFTIAGGASGLPSGPSADYEDGLASGVRFNHVSGVTITHLAVNNTAGNSLSFWGASHVRVVASDLQRSGRDGIIFFWSNQSRTSDIVVKANNIASVGDDAIAVNGTNKTIPNLLGGLPARIAIVDNRIAGWRLDPNYKVQGRGIALLGVIQAAVTGNSIVDIAGSGILLRGSDQPGEIDSSTGRAWVSDLVLIADNRIDRIGFNALDNPVATGRGNYRADGIELNGGTRVQLARNLIGTVVGRPTAFGPCTLCTGLTN